METLRASQRLERLPPYPLSELGRIKRRLLAEGREVIDLGAGESIAPPPAVAVEALRAALDDPAMSRYGFQLGYVPFREAAAAYMERRFGVRLDPMTEVLPVIGSKDGLGTLALAVTDPGDVVIVPDPGFGTYLAAAVAANADPYLAPLTASNEFLVQLDAVPSSVLAKGRLAYLNYPNNPTTALAPREYLERVVAICQRQGIVLAYDNPYAEVTFDGYRAPSVLEIPGAANVAVEFHSMSKSFCMTGWRLGWVAGNAQVIAALSGMKSLLDTGPLLAVQRASVPVLERAEEIAGAIVVEYGRRRDALVAALRTAGLVCGAPRGTPYLWLALPEQTRSAAFARRLLEDEAVVTLPGSAFGAGGEGYVRLALGESADRLAEAAERIARVCAAAV